MTQSRAVLETAPKSLHSPKQTDSAVDSFKEAPSYKEDPLCHTIPPRLR